MIKQHNDKIFIIHIYTFDIKVNLTLNQENAFKNELPYYTYSPI